MAKKESASPPLAGLLVVSLEQALAAPLATCRLAEMGARVIKVERPEGDFARGYDCAANGLSSYFVWTNRGKESVTLDFKQAADKRLLEAMLARADVMVQNLAPGAMARIGLDSERLRSRHPRLITCDITGYGRAPAVQGLKAYDLLVQCESGLAALTGSPESCGRVGVSICDIGAGLNATIAILSALRQRDLTGKGCGVSVSLFDAVADWMTVPYLHSRYGPGAPTRQGLRHPSIAPYGAYETRDGVTIVISVQNEREWRAFCEHVLDAPELASDARFESNDQRVRYRDSLEPYLCRCFGGLTLSDCEQRLQRANIAYGRVRSVEEMAQHPALRTWQMPVGSEDLTMVAPPVEAPWDCGRFAAAPECGEHTTAIRTEFLDA